MKKTVSMILSATMLSSVVLGAAACGEKVSYQADPFDSAEATYTAYLAGETNEISDTLFGIFLEDINYAGYALDDNMVVNGSFESTHNAAKTYGWGVNNAELTIENSDGALANLNETYRQANTNPNYAKVVVKEAGGGVSNSGYAAVPFAVKEGTDYVFTAFVKATEDVNMTVTLGEGSSNLLESTIALKAGGWTKYKQTIKATGSANEKLVLRLSFNAATTVYLDAVQLETTDSTLGFTQYMYDAIADLAPKFIRFPGGCVIEGNGAINLNGENGLEDSAYDWKNSIGAAVTGKNPGDDDVPALTYSLVENNGAAINVTTYGEQITRTPNQDLWAGTGSNYYDMEYGIGFYEYFLLCDSLNASAVPVLNCGLSCQGGAASSPRTLLGRHSNEVEDYIQDALDLVAFATGDVNASDPNEKKWAGIRASLGHEAPFEMTYLGIGNEQWGTYYTGYYNYFVEAFKEAAKENPLYGKVQLIVGNGPSFLDCEGVPNGTGGTAKSAAKSYRTKGGITNLTEYGVHDHHYYRNYTEFLKYSNLYDSYSRDEKDKYYVFVGEYSANESKLIDGTSTFSQINNSWVTALSEAAFMTGLERNADIVKLAAYAPVFAAKNYSNHWSADMMFYTNEEISFTPNYYVQQLFMKNQGNYTVQSDMTTAATFESQFSIQGSTTISVDKLYSSFSVEEATGDIIVKIVNACDEAINVNFNMMLKSGMQIKSAADVTVLQNDRLDAISDIGYPAVSPETFKVGVTNRFGYTAPKYSATVIRLHTK